MLNDQRVLLMWIDVKLCEMFVKFRLTYVVVTEPETPEMERGALRRGEHGATIPLPSSPYGIDLQDAYGALMGKFQARQGPKVPFHTRKTHSFKGN